MTDCPKGGEGGGSGKVTKCDMEGREMSEERVVTGGRLAVVGTFEIKFRILKPVSTRICQQLEKHNVESLLPQAPGRGRSSEGEESASLTPSSTL